MILYAYIFKYNAVKYGLTHCRPEDWGMCAPVSSTESRVELRYGQVGKDYLNHIRQLTITEKLAIVSRLMMNINTILGHI